LSVWWLIALAAGIVLPVVIVGPMRRLYRDVQAERAYELFSLQRESLELKFVELAHARHEGSDDSWDECVFSEAVHFARQARSGEVVAFVDVQVVTSTPSLPRRAAAVFHYHHGQWGTGGRLLLDMSAVDAVEHFAEDYEPLSFPHG
jgi:hypothetical protein